MSPAIDTVDDQVTPVLELVGEPFGAASGPSTRRRSRKAMTNPLEGRHFRRLAQKAGLGKDFERRKAEFAAMFVDSIDLESQLKVLDWKEKINSLCKHIQKWNRIASP
jgi:hypothetical protein